LRQVRAAAPRHLKHLSEIGPRARGACSPRPLADHGPRIAAIDWSGCLRQVLDSAVLIDLGEAGSPRTVPAPRATVPGIGRHRCRTSRISVFKIIAVRPVPTNASMTGQTIRLGCVDELQAKQRLLASWKT